MKYLPFLFLGLLLIFGCINQKQIDDPNQTISQVSGSLDDRSFIYDSGANVTGPVSRTIAQNIYQDSAAAMFGTNNLTVRNCFFLTNHYAKRECLTQAAVYLNDSSICDKLPGNYAAFCFYRYATKKLDSAFCYKSDTQQQLCFSQIAIMTGNPSLCVKSNQLNQNAEMQSVCNSLASSAKLVGKPECNEDIVSVLMLEIPEFSKTISWLSTNHPGEKVLSWWDYGLSLDCMGSKSVISNKNLDNPQILQVANLLVEANESKLALFMKSNNIKYLMLNSELLYANNAFGGKFGALNYLSCAYDGKTSVANVPGSSSCENNNLWETVFVALNSSCPLPENQSGLIAYKLYYSDYPLVTYQDCSSLSNPASCRDNFKAVPAYCIGEATSTTGSKIQVPFTLDQNGDQKLIKAQLELPVSYGNTSILGPVTSVTFIFTKEKTWPNNGTFVDGYNDRTKPFYGSILYKGLILGSIDGFKQIYPDSQGIIRVFELSE